MKQSAKSTSSEGDWQAPMRSKPAADYLREKFGFGSVSELARGAMNGTGPRFFKTSTQLRLYFPRDLDAYALAKLGDARVDADKRVPKAATLGEGPADAPQT